MVETAETVVAMAAVATVAVVMAAVVMAAVVMAGGAETAGELFWRPNSSIVAQELQSAPLPTGWWTTF